MLTGECGSISQGTLGGELSHQEMVPSSLGVVFLFFVLQYLVLRLGPRAFGRQALYL